MELRFRLTVSLQDVFSFLLILYNEKTGALSITSKKTCMMTLSLKLACKVSSIPLNYHIHAEEHQFPIRRCHMYLIASSGLEHDDSQTEQMTDVSACEQINNQNYPSPAAVWLHPIKNLKISFLHLSQPCAGHICHVELPIKT